MVRIRELSAGENNSCPICIDDIKYGVETNCGHIYCANCIMNVWEQNALSHEDVSCPYCRQKVKMLLTCFTESESNPRSASEMAEKEALCIRIDEYNRLHSDSYYSWFQQMKDLPTVFKHIWAQLFTWNGLELMYRIRIFMCLVGAFLYAVLPYDFLPEAFLGLFGLVDDIIIVLFLVSQVSLMFRHHLVTEP